MLIMQSMENRIDSICSKLAVAKGQDYADACKQFIMKLYEQGKLVGKSPFATMQGFWTDTALECVKLLLSSQEYEYDADAQGYLLALEADIQEDLKQQEFAVKNKIWY